MMRIFFPYHEYFEDCNKRLIQKIFNEIVAIASSLSKTKKLQLPVPPTRYESSRIMFQTSLL